jgi:hypothetical protein
MDDAPLSRCQVAKSHNSLLAARFIRSVESQLDYRCPTAFAIF